MAVPSLDVPFYSPAILIGLFKRELQLKGKYFS